MFGLFRTKNGEAIERRGFGFTRQTRGESGVDGLLEIRVYRSKGRKRVEPELETFDQSTARYANVGDKLKDENKGVR